MSISAPNGVNAKFCVVVDAVDQTDTGAHSRSVSSSTRLCPSRCPRLVHRVLPAYRCWSHVRCRDRSGRRDRVAGRSTRHHAGQGSAARRRALVELEAADSSQPPTVLVAWLAGRVVLLRVPERTVVNRIDGQRAVIGPTAIRLCVERRFRRRGWFRSASRRRRGGRDT